MSSNPPYRITDDSLVDVVREAYDDGNTDAIGGGVPPAEVAGRLDVDSIRNIRRRLHELAEDDQLVAVLGVNPDSWRRRTSYLCPEQVNNPNMFGKYARK